MDTGFGNGNLKDRVLGAAPIYYHPNINEEAGLESFKGIGKYSPRQLAVLRAGDVMALAADTRASVLPLVRLYRDELGLSCPNESELLFLDYQDPHTVSDAVLANRSLIETALGRKNIRHMVPFFHSNGVDRIKETFGLTTDTNNSAHVNNVNDKWLSQLGWREQNLPTCEGRLVRSIEDARDALDSFSKYPNICVKVRRSVSGQGVKKVARKYVLRYLRKHIEELHTNGLIVEPWFDGINPEVGFPSVQLYVGKTPDRDEVICSTFQIMGGEDNEVHKGNILAPNFLDNNSRRTDVTKICDWARKNAFSGICGVDFIIAEGATRCSDPNMRHTGATSAAILVSELLGSAANQGHWTVDNNVHVPEHSTAEAVLAGLRSNGLLYRNQRGIVPTNLSTPGKVMLVVVSPESTQDSKKLLEQAKALFH